MCGMAVRLTGFDGIGGGPPVGNGGGKLDELLRQNGEGVDAFDPGGGTLGTGGTVCCGIDPIFGVTETESFGERPLTLLVLPLHWRPAMLFGPIPPPTRISISA
mmetsp:Transcript_13802/g.24522  ORF Transcript_13802/g.24522 Transcript_13802/m.24522 type:complete len:104 (-) Transcript_13802:1285-1596(-)